MVLQAWQQQLVEPTQAQAAAGQHLLLLVAAAAAVALLLRVETAAVQHAAGLVRCATRCC
jgi:hypothetical protein